MKKKYFIYIFVFLLIVIIVYAANSYNVAESTNQYIDEHSVCKKVTLGDCPSPAAGLFVPTKTSGAWGAFRSNSSVCSGSISTADSDGDTYDSDSCTTGDDCYDSNASAKPGQTTYYTTDRGDGSYDYNCDSTETKQWTTMCGFDSEGWSGRGVPACGVTRGYCDFCSGSCPDRTQKCR